MADEYTGLNRNAFQDATAIEDLARAGVEKHASTIAFHAQQAAEKQLKNALVEHGVVPPKIHPIDDLLNLCSEKGMLSPTPDQIRSAQRLSVHAVATRYDSALDIDKGEALEAIADCNTIADMLEQAGFQPVRINVEARFLRDNAVERQEDATEE